MGKKRIAAVIIAMVTFLGSVLAQMELGTPQYRVHQHRDWKSEEELGIADGKSCIHETNTSGYTYDSNAVDTAELKTHLPIVVIDVPDKIPGKPYHGEEGTEYTLAPDGDTYTMAKMKVIDHRDRYNQVSDEEELSSLIRIRVRGNSSRWFEKSSYSIKTVEESGDYRNVAVMGMEKHHEWVLNGPYLDKSLMRNYMAMNLSGELMEYAPDVRYCEVVVNGEYKGLYLMMETVSRGKGRIDIEKPNKTRNITGYIIELDNDSVQPPTALDNFTKYASILRERAFFDIVYPGKLNLTPELQDYIERDVSAFEKALYSFDYDSLRYGYPVKTDVDQFVDYFIIMEVFMQYDVGNRSTFFYKDINGRFKPCVWDFNNSLDNAAINLELDDYHISGFFSIQSPWFWMMLKEEDFIDQIIREYRSLREGILSDDSLKEYIRDTGAYLGSAVDRNFAVWGYTFEPQNLQWNNKLIPDERNPSSYEEAVQQMENTLLDRVDWLDKHIEVLKQYGHESAVKKFNH